MGSRLIVFVGIFALIYLQTILVERIVSRDGLPRGVLPSGILKIEKYCPGLKVPVSFNASYLMSYGIIPMPVSTLNPPTI